MMIASKSGTGYGATWNGFPLVPLALNGSIPFAKTEPDWPKVVTALAPGFCEVDVMTLAPASVVPGPLSTVESGSKPVGPPAVPGSVPGTVSVTELVNAPLRPGNCELLG